MFKLILAAIVVTIVVIVSFSAIKSVTGGGGGNNPTSSITDESNLNVTITGEVTHPGTYLLPLKSELRNLIEAGGGTTSNADSRCFNLDYALLSGGTYYIAPLYDNSNTCAITPLSKVNINSADKATLSNLETIGTTLANAIVAHREKNGTFKAIEEIKNVDGIGPATFEKVKMNICLRD